MPLLATAFTSVCVGLMPGTYDMACNKALEAGTKQTGIYQQSEQVENKSLEYVTEKGEKNLGKPVAVVLASGPFLYKSYKEKTLRFNVPNFGLCDRISNEITPNSYSVKFGWHW